MFPKAIRFSLFYLLPLALLLYSMQASRSLFQTGIKLKGQPGQTGIAKTRPFLNVWSDRQQQSPLSTTASQASSPEPKMADAPKSFFDFTTKNGKALSFIAQ